MDGFASGARRVRLALAASSRGTATGKPARSSWLFARHLARDDRHGGESLVATYVRPVDDAAAGARLRAAILAADPGSAVTGFDAIDRALREVLTRDLVLVGGVALAMVAVAMRLALRSLRHALVALATLACEMALVGVAMRVLAVRWHVYDALVLPVLFGVTIDESMFLLHAARERPHGGGAARAGTARGGDGPHDGCGLRGARSRAASTGCATSGAVGTLGVLAGLVAALVVVPAAVRVLAP